MPALRERPLDEADLDPDPLRQFAAWLAEARGTDLLLPEAMAVATATPAGEPSARMVLLKRFDETGFVFHTHYDSRKGRELEANPRAALLFHWEPLGRQVRVEGRAERTAAAESETYFRTRPRGGQLAAWASHQSEPVAGRAALDAAFAAADRRFADAEVPLPPAWGGIRVVPEAYEFWQHRENRFHDRFRYERGAAGWRIVRLAP